MSKRTDIHCPTNFKPQDYDVIDYFGVVTFPGLDCQDGPDQESYGDEARRYYEEGDRSGNPHPDTNQCDLCGARFNHGAVLAHKDGDVITIGGICMSGIAGVPALTDGQKLYNAKREKRRRERAAKLRVALAENPGINRALKTNHYISQDLRAKLIEWGSLSDRQIELAFKIERDVANRPPELEPTPVPVTDDRVRVEGIILSTREEDGYAYNTTVTKCLIQVPTDGGAFKLWGTLPQKATDAQWDHEREHGEWPEIKGAKIAFTARLEPSRDDEAFGFYKRPTKVEVEFPKPEPVAPDADYVCPEPSETSIAAF